MFGKRLAELRAEKGLTQIQLANILNVSSGAIGMYETERRKLDSDKLVTFCDFFDVSIDYLLGRTDIRQPISLAINEEKQELFELYDKLTYRNQIALQERAKILIERQAEDAASSKAKLK